jgi:hypothetical protein
MSRRNQRAVFKNRRDREAEEVEAKPADPLRDPVKIDVEKPVPKKATAKRKTKPKVKAKARKGGKRA